MVSSRSPPESSIETSPPGPARRPVDSSSSVAAEPVEILDPDDARGVEQRVPRRVAAGDRAGMGQGGGGGGLGAADLEHDDRDGGARRHGAARGAARPGRAPLR